MTIGKPNWSKEIVKILDGIASWSHVRVGRIFEDWATITKATLEMLPRHLESAQRTGRPAEDPPDIQEIWSRMRAKYDQRHFDGFAQAFQVLLDSAQLYQDTIGRVYMEIGMRGHGQFFTPWDIALVMAKMSTDNGHDIERMAKERIEEAAYPILKMGELMGAHPTTNQAWYQALAGIVARSDGMTYNPVTVNDPACGSGNLLLAVASLVPQWMNHMGAVQYYGQDIDPACVTMTEINVMLYGLNGHAVYVERIHEQPVMMENEHKPIVMESPIPVEQVRQLELF